MSPTITGLATNVMSVAFERIETIYEHLVDRLHAQVLLWGTVEADMPTVQADNPSDLIEDIRRAAVTKWTLAQLIRSRPQVLPPEDLKYESIFVSSLIQLGDAESLDHIANAVADLKSHIQGSTWDFDAVPAEAAAEEGAPDDGLGFNTDLGEVVPGPEEPAP